MNKFNIGDRVRIKDYNNLPRHMQTCAIARLAGKEAVIEDRLYSDAREAYIYVLTVDGYDTKSSVQFPEESLETKAPVTYRHDFEYLNNIVIAKFIKVEDGVETEIGRGHGHIIHEGDYGVAQAASYALKKIAYNMNGGNGFGRRDEE